MIVAYEPKWRAELDRLGALMHAESVYRDLPLDMDKCLRIAQFVILNIEGEKATGMFAAVKTQYFFCDLWVAWDLVHYVEPEARGSLVAVKFLNAYETWARLQGCYEINIQQHTGVEVERTTMLYRAKGFDIVGSNARKVIG